MGTRMPAPYCSSASGLCRSVVSRITIAVQAGASLAISSFATDGFQNAGTISVASGGGLTLNGGIRNTGSISLGNATSSLVLWGSDTVSGLGAISSSGADIAIWGTLDNTVVTFSSGLRALHLSESPLFDCLVQTLACDHLHVLERVI